MVSNNSYALEPKDYRCALLVSKPMNLSERNVHTHATSSALLVDLLPTRGYGTSNDDRGNAERVILCSGNEFTEIRTKFSMANLNKEKIDAEGMAPYFSERLISKSAQQLNIPLATEWFPYYGVPLGELKYPELGIRGNMFLSDDHSIVLDKFTHSPQKIGSISRQHLKDSVLFLTTPSYEHHPRREQLEATSMHVPVESYEVFEYLEGAEEAEESDENVDVLLLTLKKRPPPELSLHPYSTNNDADASISEDYWDSPFSLPQARDVQVAFLLTNGARLTDYKWIGLYDQCKNKSIPLVSLADVDPPREEEIGQIKGLERNISSGIVRILNCNTILVPDLYLDVDLKFPHTFFFVGVGNLTHIVHQVKGRAIGYERNDPLEKHTGDALMIRLPRRIRTFDVDFLSIYNEDEKKVYGYMDLPSVLVPPCADDI
ncbi:unnamed protein product [Angiostrongylus costaricensis]|uniref:DM13 domain-containing protein n=1 Tax=Angiostrongylus costaricensis TaxID=334426 RepID=A0A0R3PM24_ANGCS|nr:unnamed protein product [Angiostrongylus costaricensis]